MKKVSPKEFEKLKTRGQSGIYIDVIRAMDCGECLKFVFETDAEFMTGRNSISQCVYRYGDGGYSMKSSKKLKVVFVIRKEN